MKDSAPSHLSRMLLSAACVVVILWGVRAASGILGPLFLALMFAYTVAPFPRWLVRRFHFSKGAAIAMTAVAAAAAGLYLVFSLGLATTRIEEKLPFYQERLTILSDQVILFLSGHGMQTPSLSMKSLLAMSRVREIASLFLAGAGDMISDALLIGLLGVLFVVELTNDMGGKFSALATRLDYYGVDARGYIAVAAKAAGINAVINLVFLFAMGVDNPVVWSFLYFFLDFVPTLGYIVALVPPTLVTLLVYGWKRAALVACGLILTNVIVDNAVTPIFMKKAVNVSFLEITLSLLGWGFLLGLTGAILAIPLTLALKRFILKNSEEDQEPALAPSG